MNSSEPPFGPRTRNSPITTVVDTACAGAASGTVRSTIAKAMTPVIRRRPTTHPPTTHALTARQTRDGSGQSVSGPDARRVSSACAWNTAPMSLWLDGLERTYPPLEGDATADVAIVGGGIAGIASAYFLAKA